MIQKQKAESRKQKWVTGLYLCFLLSAFCFAMPLFACPVCFGAPDDPMMKGMNNGIWVLLGFVGFVQIGLIAMFWSFWKRARDRRRFREQFHVIHPSDGELHT